MDTANNNQRPVKNSFRGFEPLTANYVYCPNQFFDVCLPNCSRGAVRIVAYVLRQTLGWLDRKGNPIQQEISVSYRELIEKAGVSRGAIGPSLKEAVDAGFLTCIQKGSPHVRGETARTATYRLRWDQTGEYQRNDKRLTGFFAGEGHRTPVPNAFFDQIVPRESLSVIKVVGTVIRHTIGYQNQFGGRRMEAPLAYRFISRYANLSNGRVLTLAIQTALTAGYIECVTEGVFAYDQSQRQAAEYTVRWLDAEEKETIGSKKPTAQPAESDRFKKTSSIGSGSPAGDRFKTASNKKTNSKDTDKQQIVDAEKNAKQETSNVIESLMKQGIDQRTAQVMANQHAAEVIRQQIAWLPSRKPSENPAGMLRRAIEGNWPQSPEVAVREKHRERRQQQRLLQRQQNSDDIVVATRKKERREHQQRLLQEWGTASLEERQRWIQAAARRETSTRLADIIRRENVQATKPHLQVLDVIAAEKNLPGVLQLHDSVDNSVGKSMSNRSAGTR